MKVLQLITRKFHTTKGFNYHLYNFTATLLIIESCEETHNLINKEIRFPSTNPSLDVEQNCSWRIRAPIDQSIILIKVNKEEIEQTISKQNSNSSQIGEKICGSSNLESLESMGRDIYIVYSSAEVNSSDRFTIGVNLPGIQQYELIYLYATVIKP